MYVTLSESFDLETDAVVEAGRARPVTKLRSMRKVRAGQTLFREADDAGLLFEVITGVLRLSRVTSGGRRQVISFGFPGDVLGFPVDGRYRADCDVL